MEIDREGSKIRSEKVGENDGDYLLRETLEVIFWIQRVWTQRLRKASEALIQCESGVAHLCHKVRSLIGFSEDMNQLSIPMPIYQTPNPLHQRRTRVIIINSIRDKLQSNLRVTLDRYLTKAFILKHLQVINDTSKLGLDDFAATNTMTETEEEVTGSVAGNASTSGISNRLKVRTVDIALHSIMIRRFPTNPPNI
ncbi:putative ribonuclease H protein [Senna tora]|uniref:Putative ribonuclease H protein n=1 Tax=Senna tora TaxID=362788 RepID=A0A834U2L4_9FABA|nr:putative ribonuclease H protein [Senna tora]